MRNTIPSAKNSIQIFIDGEMSLLVVYKKNEQQNIFDLDTGSGRRETPVHSRLLPVFKIP
jgi:hypothetical protein